MAPFPVDASRGDGRGCARLGAGGTPALPGAVRPAGGSRHRAGGTPALPGSRHPMTSSQQGHKIAEALGYCMWLKEVHLSSGLFVFIRVHSWCILCIDRSVYSPSRMDLPSRGGRAPGLRANGSFPKGARRLSEKSPARHPPPHRRGGIAWERGRPARILSLWPPLSFSAMLQAATLSAATAAARPKESHGAVPG